MAKKKARKRPRRGRRPLGESTMPSHVHVRLSNDLYKKLLVLRREARREVPREGGVLNRNEVSFGLVLRALLFGSDKARTGETSIRLYLKHLEKLRAEQTE